MKFDYLDAVVAKKLNGLNKSHIDAIVSAETTVEDSFMPIVQKRNTGYNLKTSHAPRSPSPVANQMIETNVSSQNSTASAAHLKKIL